MFAVYIAGGFAGMILILVILWNVLVVGADPDEWLLRIRHGKMADSGIGVMMLRRPGDIFARFSSTIQRVGFSIETLSSDRIKVTLQGFILWSVADREDAPFVAFRSLGLANLLKPPSDLGHPKHLLTKPQYRAFQQIVGATAQRFVSTLELESMLRDQESFVIGLGRRLSDDIGVRGIVINQVELLHMEPTDPEILGALCVREDERIREEASQVRLETSERINGRKREKATREAKEEAEAKHKRAAHEALVALELEKERARMLEQKQDIQVQELDSVAQIRERELVLKHEQSVRDELRSKELLESRLARQQRELDFDLLKLTSRAEANRDADLAGLSVEAQKPQEVRDYELARFTAEKLSDIVDIKEGRWVTVGDSPAASLGALLESLRGIVGAKD
jgi:hypothetical protein